MNEHIIHVMSLADIDRNIRFYYQEANDSDIIAIAVHALKEEKKRRLTPGHECVSGCRRLGSCANQPDPPGPPSPPTTPDRPKGYA